MTPSPCPGREGRSEGSFRLGLAAAFLLVFAASMIATLSLPELPRRFTLFGRSLAGERIPLAKTTGFWFDPAYAEFLDAVQRRTPRDATIAIVVPTWPDVYVYQAAYQLAPRRVVEASREREATFVAAYRYQYRRSLDPDVVELPNGALFRRR
jgi:hypothetical protein